MTDNDNKTIHAPAGGDADDASLAAEEEHVLRCPGGGVEHAVENLAFEAPRRAFGNAGTMGERLDAGALRGKIARFLHKHKDGKD